MMKVFSVQEYGAIGDANTINTQSIQAAIDACHHAGGGRVVVANGKYFTGTLHLRSNIDFHIEANAVLIASTCSDDYPDFFCAEWEKETAPRGSSRCLVYAGFCENVSITGMGKIDCRGDKFCKSVPSENGVTRYVRATDILPARMIFIMGCTNVCLENFTMLEMAGGWGCWINNSQYVCVDKVKMSCNPGYPNSDGIHVNCSSDVTISNCIIHSGDDSIIVRANTKTLKTARPCERIIVKGCVLSSQHNAVRVAWRNDGLISNCVFSDLIITDSTNGLTIELPNHSNPFDFSANRTEVSHLRFNNIVMDRLTGSPVKVYIYPDNLVSGIRDIGFANITSTSAKYPLVVGRKDALLQDIYFDNCRFNVQAATSELYPVFNHVQGLRLNNTEFNLCENE